MCRLRREMQEEDEELGLEGGEEDVPLDELRLEDKGGNGNGNEVEDEGSSISALEKKWIG
jgi:hypothetical protein